MGMRACKINLGCGFTRWPGYINIDLQSFHRPDLVADALDLPLATGSAIEIVARDVLEHLPRFSIRRALCEWNRVLARGGCVHLRVPSVLDIADRLRDPENQTMDRQELFVRCLFGTQHYNGDAHFMGFTELLLRSYLERAGFAVSRWDLRDDWLFEVEAAKLAEAEGAALYRQLGSAEAKFDDAGFVRACYLLALRREPDLGGHAYHLELLRNGTRRRHIVEMLLDCEERQKNPSEYISR